VKLRSLSLAVLSLLVADARAEAATEPAEAAQQRRIEAACIGGQGVDVARGHIGIEFDRGDYSVGAPALCNWIARASLAVAGYFGRFPVDDVRLVLRVVNGAGVRGGTTYGHARDGQPLIVIRLGRDTSSAQLTNDWELTHEMVHLSVPSVPRNSHWLEEGIATYVEPIARAQRGELSDVRIWADMLHGMPKGLPGETDRGLDHTPTWGRTYWGGALFCLLADVQIRTQSHNRKGLQDALRGVLDAGGSIRDDWPVERILAAGDQATGTTVLLDLYHRLMDAPGPSAAELDALWQALGVRVQDDSARLVDDAPLAATRRAITAPRGSPVGFFDKPST
jgi:hypothetical protein